MEPEEKINGPYYLDWLLLEKLYSYSRTIIHFNNMAFQLTEQVKPLSADNGNSGFDI